ncbi:hypothetical protein [Pontixanthobacter luteolus]|uniref:hypothetical protein n=1 Tax=Pontixanthobacter luteolus TaxID=295089 RepID=UPI0023023588|nr:hypothetical protein [Pontixanthobacter luteolus]
MRFIQSLRPISAALAITLISAPAAGQTSIDPPAGDWTHRGVDVSFPETVGGFERGQATEFTSDGRDAAIGYKYNNADGTLNVTVYVYPDYSDLSCSQIFLDARNNVAEYRGAELSGQGFISPPNGGNTDFGLAARYRLPANSMREGYPALISDVYLYCPPGDKWLVKYRASWTGSEATFPDVGSFLRRIDWPAALRSNL